MKKSDPSKPYVIDTASGVRLDLDDPRPEDVRIEDVARGLSKICRFGAQPIEYYSVAQHALLVRQLVREAGHPELALAALHHDSHEAYLCDIPKPLKRKISAITDAYERVCDEFDIVIAGAFSFELPKKGSSEEAAIKSADKHALLIEATRLLPDSGEALHRDLGIRDEELRGLAPMEEPMSPDQAEAEFLRVHEELLRRTARQ